MVQGLGWMTLEEIIYDQHGRLLTDNLTAYKIPDIHFAPPIEAAFLPNEDPPAGVMHSKAVGEPPFNVRHRRLFCIGQGDTGVQSGLAA